MHIKVGIQNIKVSTTPICIENLKVDIEHIKNVSTFVMGGMICMSGVPRFSIKHKVVGIKCIKAGKEYLGWYKAYRGC